MFQVRGVVRVGETTSGCPDHRAYGRSSHAMYVCSERTPPGTLILFCLRLSRVYPPGTLVFFRTHRFVFDGQCEHEHAAGTGAGRQEQHAAAAPHRPGRLDQEPRTTRQDSRAQVRPAPVRLYVYVPYHVSAMDLTPASGTDCPKGCVVLSANLLVIVCQLSCLGGGKREERKILTTPLHHRKYALTLQLRTAHILSAHATLDQKMRSIQDLKEQKNK